ncbi:DUF6980 family protein [Streptomyces sp. NPDC004008]
MPHARRSAAGRWTTESAGPRSAVVAVVIYCHDTDDRREAEAMTRHCCAAMTDRVNRECERHDDAFASPDALILFTARFREYGLVVHDGGTSSIGIDFCPWCGQRLPESQRDRWFEELESRGIDPWNDEIPAEFQDDRWLGVSGGSL